MTGPEHYREAELLLDAARQVQADNGPGCGSEEILAEAQVRATLALAAATAMAAVNTQLPIHDSGAWCRVAGVKL